MYMFDLNRRYNRPIVAPIQIQIQVVNRLVGMGFYCFCMHLYVVRFGRKFSVDEK